MISIKVVRKTLSDRSHVYDVNVCGDGSTLVLAAYDQKHAVSLALTLSDAINHHSVEEARAIIDE